MNITQVIKVMSSDYNKELLPAEVNVYTAKFAQRRFC